MLFKLTEGKTMSYRLLLLTASAIFISACGGGGSGSSTETDENSGNGLTTVIEGEWLKSCSAVDPNDPETLYDIIRMTFTGNKMDSNILNYTDIECLTPLSFSPNPTASGEFSIGGNITTSGGWSATKMDSHITEFNGAPFEIDGYTIFSIDSDTLYFGDETGNNDGSRPDLRPITLNFNRIYIKQ